MTFEELLENELKQQSNPPLPEQQTKIEPQNKETPKQKVKEPEPEVKEKKEPATPTS